MARGAYKGLRELPEQPDVPLDDLDTSASEPDQSGRVVARQSIFGSSYVGIYDHVRKNDLLLSLGLLELANATDFAANVWNGTPPPTISIVFMVLGGTTALLILAFACRDIPRTWRNIKLLRNERRTLRLRQTRLVDRCNEVPQDGLSERDILVYGDINTRELGNEVVDRLAMGIALGFGAFTVGAGTFIAIAGANPRAFLASNILTGYLGNVPAALYGLGNTAWCIYGWRRAQGHVKAINSRMSDDGTWTKHVDVPEMLRMREGRVKTHAIVNGWSGILGGAGSLMTASAYIHPHAVWGYLILIPCIISAVFANTMWRHRINYDREIIEPEALDPPELLNEAGFAALREILMLQYCHSLRKQWVPWRTRRDLKVATISMEKSQAFLAAYHDLAVQKLKSAAELITRQLEAVQNGDKEAWRGNPLRQKLKGTEEQLRMAGSHAARFGQPSAGQIMELTVLDIILGLVAVLKDLRLYPSLIARIANDPTTAHTLGMSDSLAMDHLMHDAKAFEQQLLDCEGSLAGDIQLIALEILVNEGVHATSSRTRYLLELVGCYFQDRVV